MREADFEVMLRAAVYMDTPEALHEAGDLSLPMASVLISSNHIRGTLAELAKEAIGRRNNPQQITLFKAAGAGLAESRRSRIGVWLALRQRAVFKPDDRLGL